MVGKLHFRDIMAVVSSQRMENLTTKIMLNALLIGQTLRLNIFLSNYPNRNKHFGMKTLFYSSYYRLIFSLVISISSSCAFADNEYNNNEIEHTIERIINKDKSEYRIITLKTGLSLPINIDATPKGNGTININGLIIRIFDQHDDGTVYENNYLTLDTKDLTGDGIKEILISGILKFTGEKEKDPASYAPILLIYQLDCKSGYIIPLFTTGSSLIEIINNQHSQISCS